jgi:hypothetical protein
MLTLPGKGTVPTYCVGSAGAAIRTWPELFLSLSREGAGKGGLAGDGKLPGDFGQCFS